MNGILINGLTKNCPNFVRNRKEFSFQPKRVFAFVIQLNKSFGQIEIRVKANDFCQGVACKMCENINMRVHIPESRSFML